MIQIVLALDCFRGTLIKQTNMKKLKKLEVKKDWNWVCKASNREINVKSGMKEGRRHMKEEEILNGK